MQVSTNRCQHLYVDASMYLYVDASQASICRCFPPSQSGLSILKPLPDYTGVPRHALADSRSPSPLHLLANLYLGRGDSDLDQLLIRNVGCLGFPVAFLDDQFYGLEPFPLVFVISEKLGKSDTYTSLRGRH